MTDYIALDVNRMEIQLFTFNIIVYNIHLHGNTDCVRIRLTMTITNTQILSCLKFKSNQSKPQGVKSVSPKE